MSRSQLLIVPVLLAYAAAPVPETTTPKAGASIATPATRPVSALQKWKLIVGSNEALAAAIFEGVVDHLISPKERIEMIFGVVERSHGAIDFIEDETTFQVVGLDAVAFGTQSDGSLHLREIKIRTEQ